MILALARANHRTAHAPRVPSIAGARMSQRKKAVHCHPRSLLEAEGYLEMWDSSRSAYDASGDKRTWSLLSEIGNVKIAMVNTAIDCPRRSEVVVSSRSVIIKPRIAWPPSSPEETRRHYRHHLRNARRHAPLDCSHSSCAFVCLQSSCCAERGGYQCVDSDNAYSWVQGVARAGPRFPVVSLMHNDSQCARISCFGDRRCRGNCFLEGLEELVSDNVNVSPAQKLLYSAAHSC